MKVIPNGVNSVINRNSDMGKISDLKVKSGKAPEKMDSIKISGVKKRTTEQLVNSLKMQIMQDVKSGIDSHKLEDLKKEIASGEYDINPSDIARKITGE